MIEVGRDVTRWCHGYFKRAFLVCVCGSYVGTIGLRKQRVCAKSKMVSGFMWLTKACDRRIVLLVRHSVQASKIIRILLL
jgi:hypothetical protein